MDEKLIDEVRSAAEGKLGGDFTPHSFVVASNANVENVQFVYTIDGTGVASPNDDHVTEDAPGEPQETIWDRFIALFTS